VIAGLGHQILTRNSLSCTVSANGEGVGEGVGKGSGIGKREKEGKETLA